MLSDLIRKEVHSVKKDLVMQFGDEHDGVIEFPGLVNKGVIEVGYFYGDDKPKNIIVISPQVGCPCRCNFCELGSEKFVRSLNADELYDQVVLMLQTAKQYGIDIDAIKHKVSIAKTGEPLFNKNLVTGLEKIAQLGTSFKISTVFPKGRRAYFNKIAEFAAFYKEPVQLQISLISTSEEYRKKAVGIKTASFKEIRSAASYWCGINNHDRKVNLSLILTEDVPCDVKDVVNVLPPRLFRFRFRNYVPTTNGDNYDLVTITQQRFEDIKNSFQDNGYEVGDWATPTETEQKFGLASNVTRRRYLDWVK